MTLSHTSTQQEEKKKQEGTPAAETERERDGTSSLVLQRWYVSLCVHGCMSAPQTLTTAATVDSQSDGLTDWQPLLSPDSATGNPVKKLCSQAETREGRGKSRNEEPGKRENK